MEADSPPVPLDQLLGHAAWVRGLAASLLRDPAATDDVVQETWLAALETPPRDNRNLRGWLGRVVRNAVRQRGRGAARRAWREQVAGEEREPLTESPEVLAERVETQRRLAARVLELDEPFRQTLLLRFYEELSSAEIARRTGTPEGTVRWRLKRGLDELRERLDDDYGSRRTWCLALIPLARRASPSEVALVSGTTGLSGLLQGLLAMNLFLKLTLVTGLVLGTVLLAPIGARLFGLLSSERTGVEAVAVTFRPLERQDAAPAREEAVPGEESRRTSVVAVEAAPASSHVSGRLVDARGGMVSGATVGLRGIPASERSSGASGAFHVPLPETWHAYERGRGTVVVDAPGFLVEEVAFVPSRGADVELGELTLRRAGAIEGVVVDAAGHPVEGAWVSFDRVERSARLLEEQVLERSIEGPVSRLLGVENASTDAQGRFLLERVAPGHNQVWAGKEGLQAGTSGSVETRPDQISGGVTVQLGVLDPADVLWGVVLDPDGEPVPRARLEMEYDSGRRSGSSSFVADENGRFRKAYAPRIPRSLRASDLEQRYGTAVLTGVEGGPDEIVLSLSEPEWMTVEVVGPEGPLPAAELGVFAASLQRSLTGTDEVRREGTRLRFALPAEPFHVVVEHAGFEVNTVGPFDGLAAPRELTVELAPLPGVRGRVRAGGGPASGARVELLRRHERRTTVDGFPVRNERRPEVEGLTDAEGAFELTLRRAGSFTLRVELDGFAPRELGPFELDPAVGLSGLALELDQGCVLEGRVLAAPGDSPAGTIVAISRGDARARTQRVGADGRYRFERLVPGPWFVTRRDSPITGMGYASTSDSDPFDESQVPSNCEVVRGQITRFDLDLGAEAAGPRLIGSLLIDGAGPEGWTAQLFRDEGSRVFSANERPTGIGADGSFELARTEPGRYRLTLQAPGAGQGRGTTISVPLELPPGLTTWSRSLSTGTLVVEDPAPLHPEGVALDYFLLETGGIEVVLPIVPDDGGETATLTGVPAGAGRLVRFTVEEFVQLASFPYERHGLVDVVIRPGETTRVRLPE